MPAFPQCGRRCPPSGAARRAAELVSCTESMVVRLTVAGPPRQNRRGRPFRLRRCRMTPWRPSWRRPGCPGSGIPGAWRARSGQTGGAWWTFGQKHPPEGEGLSRSPAHGGHYPLVVNTWQTGSVLSPGYIGSTEHRLCEPQFQPSPALPGLPAYAQDYLGSGIVPTPQTG